MKKLLQKWLDNVNSCTRNAWLKNKYELSIKRSFIIYPSLQYSQQNCLENSLQNSLQYRLQYNLQYSLEYSLQHILLYSQMILMSMALAYLLSLPQAFVYFLRTARRQDKSSMKNSFNQNDVICFRSDDEKTLYNK